MLLILEDLGKTGSVSKEVMLLREQLYIDKLFSKYSSLTLNNSPTAASTLGFKHKPEFGLKRSGSARSYRSVNPSFGGKKKLFQMNLFKCRNAVKSE